MENKLIRILRETVSSNKLIAKIKELNPNQKLLTSELSGSYKFLLTSFLAQENKQIVLLFPSVQLVNEAKVELIFLGLKEELITIDNLNIDIIQERITELNSKGNYILLAPYDILTFNLPKKETVQNNTFVIETGGKIGYEEIIEHLNLLNFDRDKYVDSQGSYSVRGSIIDFWSFSEHNPCRLEFDGNFLESIRYFNTESQRSLGITEKVTLASSIENSELTIDSDIFNYLENPLIIASQTELDVLFDINIEEEPQTLITEELDEELRGELFEGNKNLKKEKSEKISRSINSQKELFSKNAHWLITSGFAEEEALQLNILHAPIINSNYSLLSQTLQNFAQQGFTLYITSENELQVNKLKNLLSELNKELLELLDKGILKIITLPIKEGFIIKEEKILVLTDYEIFNKPYRTKISSNKKYTKQSSKDFGSIKKGDYVVHETYGIGKYQGLETIKIGMSQQECIRILYAGGDIVFVNLNYLGLVKKFSKKDEASPTLSRLGSNEWKNTKKKVKKKIQEAARDLIKLYAERKSSNGFHFSPDTIWQKELEASFFYEDTPDQSKVTEEVKEDMQSESPMDRLVCGDVGFGKTEIAVRAAFKAVNDGKQTAILVPTTILAEQHYNTFKDRLAQFPVKVNVLSRFRTKTQQKQTVKNLYNGKTDVVIGTHRLLSKDIEFKNLGLLIIDEEQRFGVMAKEKLRQLKANVDTLTLTATPIPRTLNLSLLGARDLSIIATPPPNRQPIYTKVEIFDIEKIKEWTRSEMKRNGQIYFVHDRIQSIDKIYNYLKKHIPEISIAVAHGQMKPSELENVIFDFMNKKYDMLLATKIIESGIDIPNANTIIVNRADRFGLSELHQLRGRVGRADRKAFAYFIVPSLNTITQKAIKRLQAIEEYSDVGEGFNLSMRDLEIRGAGNLLGTEQSGSIGAVGFDMYVKLLDEAVRELKETEFTDVFKKLPPSKERSEPAIDTYFEIGIPEDYMPEQADRLSFYTVLFSVSNESEIKEIAEELIDRFGKAPYKVELLILAAILRYNASFIMFEKIVIKKDSISLILPKGDNENYYKTKFQKLLQFIMENYSKEVRFIQQKEVMKLVKNNRYTDEKSTLEAVISFCKIIKNNIFKTEEFNNEEI